MGKIEQVIRILEKQKEHTESVVENFLSYSSNEITEARQTIEMCDMAIGALKEIQQYPKIGMEDEATREYKHMNDGWIPVDERLPEKRVRYVWITVDHGTIWQRILAKWDGENFKSIYGTEFYCKIIAWQECKAPEPYRPERIGTIHEGVKYLEGER